MAVNISQGSAGSGKSKKEWSISSDGTRVMFFVGDSKPYILDLTTVLRKVLALEGVR